MFVPQFNINGSFHISSSNIIFTNYANDIQLQNFSQQTLPNIQEAMQSTPIPAIIHPTHNQSDGFLQNLAAFHLTKIPDMNARQRHIMYYFDIDHKKKLVTFNNGDRDMGNWLSKYWLTRSITYWMNYDFISVNHMQQIDANSFRHFLPNHTMRRVISNQSSVQFAIWPDSSNKMDCRWAHPCPLIFAAYNRYFQPLVNRDMVQALNDYYIYQNRTYKRLVITSAMTENDIVIHIRCGDVLSVGHNQYGFLTRKFYEYAASNATMEKFGIDWKQNRIREDTNVWLISQLSSKSLRPTETHLIESCKIFVVDLAEKLFKKIFAPATINIQYDSDVNDDYYKMINAPLLMCSTSTFCFHAAIANVDGIAILPSDGPWSNLMRVMGNAPQVMPANHIVIDAKKRGWYCMSKSKSCMHRYPKLSETAHKTAQYIIDH